QRPAAVGRRVVDYGRNPIVGSDREKRRRELLASTDVDGNHLVLEPGFLEKDRDLVPVGRGPVVEVDHGLGAKVASSESAGVVAAVLQDVLADDVAGVDTAKEGARRAELRGIAEAAGRRGR